MEAKILIRKTQFEPEVCPTCGNKEREYNHKRDWYLSTYKYKGEDVPCDCDLQIALLEHYVLARIPERYMRYTPDDWYGDEKGLEAVVDYLDHWDDNRKEGMGLGFYCKGVGRGKTFLATFIARELIRLSESVVFIHFTDAIALYEKPYKERQAEEDRLRDCGVLVLDEVTHTWISSEQQAFFAREFERLIRYRSDYNKVTIFTTNMEPEDMEEHFPRVYSLLADSSLEVRLGEEMNEDFRIKRREEKRAMKRKGEVAPIC